MDKFNSKTPTIYLTLLLFLCTGCSDGQNVISDRCLDCLGFQTDNNNTCVIHDTIAETHSRKNWLCGVYKISPDYFIDCKTFFNSTELGPEFGDHRNCSLDYNCARQCVSTYMRGYHSWCKGGEYLTCADFARLHAGGPHGCLALNLKNTEKFLKNLTDHCGCMDVYEDKSHCERTTTTVSPEYLAVVIAVPIICIIVLITIVVVIILCCLTRKSNRNGPTNSHTFSNLEKTLESKKGKAIAKSDEHFDKEIPRSLRRYESPKVTRTISMDHPQTSATKVEAPTLDLRDIVIPSKRKPEINEYSVDEKPITYDSGLDEDDHTADGVHAQKACEQPLEYVNFENMAEEETPTVMYENHACDAAQLNISSSRSPATRVPIPSPRPASSKSEQK